MTRLSFFANTCRVDLGVSHTPGGNNPFRPKISLIEFKEQFGARGVLRTVYKKDLNDK